MNPNADDYDDRTVTPEQLDAYYRDMLEMPMDLPTADEVDQMAKAMGADKVPF